MNKLLTILLLYVLPVAGFAQSNYTSINSIPEGTQAYWWSAGHRYAVWKAPGWTVGDTNSILVFSFGGLGEPTAPEMWSIKPFPELISGSWNGQIYKNNGDVVKVLLIGVRDTAFQNAVYTIHRNMIGAAITQAGIDTSAVPDWKVIILGLSNGSNMINRLITAGGSGQAWSDYIKRIVHAAPPQPYSTGDPAYERYNNRKVVRIHTTTTDGTTSPQFALRLKDSIVNASDASVEVITWPDNCHCAWNYAYDVSGLNDPPGTHEPDSNEWRILVNDVAYQEPQEPQEEQSHVIRVRMRIKVIE